jgi:TonB family protein
MLNASCTWKYSLLLFLAFTGCKTANWPATDFIKKYHYQEVIGVLSENKEDSSGCKHKDRFPMYPYGLEGVNAHIRDNTTYPAKAKENHIAGTVLVSYIVGKEGYVEEVKVVHSIDPLLDEEAIRVIKCMKRWIPGLCDGEVARVEYKQPFKFSLK